MAWELSIDLADVVDEYVDSTYVVQEYPTQNDARWWAVAMAQRGSVSLKMGQPDEDLIPIHNIIRFTIREV